MGVIRITPIASCRGAAGVVPCQEVLNARWYTRCWHSHMHKTTVGMVTACWCRARELAQTTRPRTQACSAVSAGIQVVRGPAAKCRNTHQGAAQQQHTAQALPPCKELRLHPQTNLHTYQTIQCAGTYTTTHLAVPPGPAPRFLPCCPPQDRPLVHQPTQMHTSPLHVPHPLLRCVLLVLSWRAPYHPPGASWRRAPLHLLHQVPHKRARTELLASSAPLALANASCTTIVIPTVSGGGVACNETITCSRVHDHIHMGASPAADAPETGRHRRAWNGEHGHKHQWATKASPTHFSCCACCARRAASAFLLASAAFLSSSASAWARMA